MTMIGKDGKRISPSPKEIKKPVKKESKKDTK